jgi:hypothetical protein
MSHWAEIDDEKIVLRTIVCDNNDPNGDEGYQWIMDNLGGRWIQTSYNHNFRFKFAVPGDIYNEEIDIFYRPRTFDGHFQYTSKLAYFAKLEENNLVVQVDTIDKNNIDLSNEEASGIAILNAKYGETFNWKQTKYNPVFRKNWAKVGFTYNEELDGFIPPKPSTGDWVLDPSTCTWEEA